MRARIRTGLLALACCAALSSVAASPASAQAPTIVTPPDYGFCGPWCVGYEIAPGTWSGAQPMSVTHRWERCLSDGSRCSVIPGATGLRYDVVSADVKRWIRFVEVAGNSFGRAEYPSASIFIDQLPTRNLVAPSFVGELREGNTVRLDPGVWQAWDGSLYQVSWVRCDGGFPNCVPIKECSAGVCDFGDPSVWHYTLTAADVGKRLRAWVFVGYRTVANTGDSAPVLPANLRLQAPLLLSRTTVTQGQTVTGEVTWRNPGGTPLLVRRAAITMRRPGATRPGGPFDDYSPIVRDVTVRPGATLTQTASFRLPANAPVGVWQVYATWLDASGVWHDDSNTVYLTVNRTAATTGGGGSGGGGSGGGGSGGGGSAGGGQTGGDDPRGGGGRSDEPRVIVITIPSGEARPGGGPTSPGLVASLSAQPARLATVRRRGVRVSVNCSKACLYDLRLTRRGDGYGRASGRLRTGERSVRLVLSRSGKRRLRRGSYVVRGTISDVAGSERRVRLPLRIR